MQSVLLLPMLSWECTLSKVGVGAPPPALHSDAAATAAAAVAADRPCGVVPASLLLLRYLSNSSGCASA